MTLYITVHGIESQQITQAQKVTQGPSGTIPMGFQVPDTGGNHTLTVVGVGGTAIRTDSRYPTAALNATQTLALQTCQANGLTPMWNMLGAYGPPPLPITDVAAYTTYFSSNVSAINALGGTIFSVRNEPDQTPTIWTNQQIIDELNLAGGIIHGVSAANIVAAPTFNNTGFSYNRNRRLLSQFIALGGLNWVDWFDFHLYQGGGSPEQCYVNEIAYIESLVHDARPGLPLSISEFGGTFEPVGKEIWGNNQAAYMARSFILYSCVRSIALISCWRVIDTTPQPPDSFGIIKASTHTQRQPTYNMVAAAFVHLNLFVERTLYTDPAAVIFYRSPSFPATDNIFGGNINVQPMFVRGTLIDGNQRMFCWHASLEGVAATIYVMASQPGTLLIQTLAGTTATSTLVPGVNPISVVLGSVPKVLYTTDGTQLSFIQHSH